MSLVQLIANPQNVEGTVVEVRGFLRFQGERRVVTAVFLSISEEDSKHMLGNEIVIVASEQMLRDREKLDRMYVNLVGTVQLSRSGNGPPTAVIGDIQSCTVWSHPNHSIGSGTEAPASK